MTSTGDLNPTVVDLFVVILLFGCILYVGLLCCGDTFKWTRFHQNRSINRSMTFYFGIALTVLINFANEHGHLGYHSMILWKVQEESSSTSPMLFKDAFTIKLNRNADGEMVNIASRESIAAEVVNDPEKVVFITTTRYRLVQPAVLTRIGQALFPVRKHVIWIVVSTSDYEDFGIVEPQIPRGNDTYLYKLEYSRRLEEFQRRKDNITIMEEYLKGVEMRLKRFGVPYVLLESHSFLNNQFLGFRVPSEDRYVIKGLQTGVIWALQHFKNGVIMVGNEDYTYQFNLFEQVRKTRIASTWPVGLGRPLGFSSPIAKIEENKQVVLKGYHSGYKVYWDDILMEIGAFALNIEYVLKNVDVSSIWRITWDKTFTLESLGIELKDVEILGEYGTKIWVWRTLTKSHSWPTTLPLKKSYQGSNMDKLLKNVFGVRYPSIPKSYNRKDQIPRKYI